MSRFSDSMPEVFNYKGKQINVCYGDITRVHADAIVSSDDNKLSMGGGVSAAILKAAGDRLWSASRRHVPAKLGTAVVTTAGNLPAKYILHAIVIDLDEWQWPDVDIVRTATANCLREADRLGCRSIAMPALGSGTGRLASEVTARVMVNTIFDEIARQANLQQVILVLYRRNLLVEFIKSSIYERIKDDYEGRLVALLREKEQLAAELRAQSPYRNLPFPVAITRRIVDSFSTYHAKFTSAVECMASILQYCAVVALADSLRLELTKKSSVTKSFQSPMTLGRWKKLLEMTLAQLNTEKAFAAIALIRNFYETNQGRFTDMIEMRNEYYGHGATVAESVYSDLYDSLMEHLEVLYVDLHALGRFPLITVEQIDLVGEGFHYDVIEIMGDNIIYPKSTLRCREIRLSRNTLYLLDREKEAALTLPPLLVFEMCPKCQVRETFFLERTGEQKWRYHTYRSNHRIDTEAYKQYLQ